MERVFKEVKSLLIAIPLMLLSCSQSDVEGGDNPPGKIKLPGTIYHQYTSEVLKIDMQSWQETVAFSYNAYSTVNWRLSPDGTIRIMSTREPGMYDRNRFTLLNTSNEAIIKEIDYIPTYGNSTTNYGKLSYDNTLIAIEPDNDNGIVILDHGRDIKYEMFGVNEQSFGWSDEVVWLPDNSILFTFRKEVLLRSAHPYTTITPVREMNYENWGNIRVRPDGKKITFYINRHVFMMDIDGQNLVQVTDSKESEEIFGEFSPDGRYLLIGADYFHAPASSGSFWLPKIIPADGKKYDMDNDPAVIPLIPVGDNSISRANRVTLWRP